LVRRCDALKAARVQELNRQKAGFASAAVATSIAAHIDWQGRQIEDVVAEVRHLAGGDPMLAQNLALLRTITGFGETSAAILLAELPNIAEFTPKALAAFAGLSPKRAFLRQFQAQHRHDQPHQTANGCAARCSCVRLSAKQTNKALSDFVDRMTGAGKPPKAVLVAVARKLLVYAHAVVRTQKPFQPGAADASPA
jgi:transposase